MVMQVTPNAISRIVSSGQQDNFLPILQVISIKIMNGAPGHADRYRVIVSDGTHYQQSMITTVQNDLVTSGQLQELCLMRLDEFIVNEVSTKRIIIILRASVVSEPVPKIGDPVSYEGGPSENKPPAPQQNSAAPVQGGYNAPPAQNNGYGAPPPAQNGYGGAQNGYNAPPAQNGYGAPPAQNGYGGGAQAPAVVPGGYGSGQATKNYRNTNNNAPARGGPYGGGASSGGNAGGYGRNSGGGNNPYGGGGGGGEGYGGGYSNHGPVQRLGGGEGNIIPISELNPYQTRWTIKARVESKSDIRRWSNQKGEGHLCSVDLIDSFGGEVRGTFFKDACDKFYPIMDVGSVYIFSGGKIKVANKQFSNVKNDYEITFDMNSTVEAADDDGSIKVLNLTFTKIANLKDVTPNDQVDIIAIIKDFGDMSTIMTKRNTEVERRNLTLVDDSNAEVQITLWGEKAKLPEDVMRENAVVAFKGVKVSDYNGCSLSSYNSTTIALNPNLEEARALSDWWHRSGQNGGFTSMTVAGASGTGGPRQDPTDIYARRTIASIKEDNLGHGEKPDWITFRGMVAFVKHDNDNGPWYTACPGEKCSKKVVETDNSWHCEKCQRTYPNCERRFILTLSLYDTTGTDWFSCFNDVAVVMLGGRTADELYDMKQSNDEAAFDEVFVEAVCKEYIFRARVKAEMVNDEQRIKSTIIEAIPIDESKETSTLNKGIIAYG